VIDAKVSIGDGHNYHGLVHQVSAVPRHTGYGQRFILYTHTRVEVHAPTGKPRQRIEQRDEENIWDITET
jgi:hypothetical protein